MSKLMAMERFVVIGQYQACTVLGGTKSVEDKVARMLGRLVGAALKALYDLLTGKLKEPQASGCQ